MSDASTTGNRDVERSAGVTVRYWAAARAAAGREVDHVDPGTVADVLDAVRALHDGNERFMRVLEICSVLVGEEPLGGTDPATVMVPAGGQLELLPPFAGGDSRHSAVGVARTNLPVGGRRRRAET